MADFKIETSMFDGIGNLIYGESFKAKPGCMPALWKYYNSGDRTAQPFCIVDNSRE